MAIKIAVMESDIEKMWTFSKSNSVLFHYIETITRNDINIFVYEALMSAETHTLFKLIVPTVAP